MCDPDLEKGNLSMEPRPN